MLCEECEVVVQDAWNKLDSGNSSLTRIKDKIASCGMDLHAWWSTRTHLDTEKKKKKKKSRNSKRKLKQLVWAS